MELLSGENKNNSKESMYIQEAELNGKEWNSFSFSHNVFSKGGELKLKLGNKPNKSIK